MRIRTTLLLLILLAASSALGSRPLETVRPGEIAYLVVVRNGAPEPDVAGLGGRLLQSWDGHRLVAIPAERAEAMTALPNVEYVQQISIGGSAVPILRPSASAIQPIAPPPWNSGTYLYDPSGNIKSIGGERNPDERRSFTYDGVGRLTKATVLTRTQSYAYDPYGNLTHLDAENLNVSPANNQFPLFDYDAAGSVTSDAGGRTYHYDALGMVTAIKVAPTDTTNGDMRFVYTADDERILVAEGSLTRYRVRDYGARVLREWKQSGGILEWERDYIYAGGTLVAGEVQLDQLQNGLRHYHSDHLGSTRMVTDGAGQLVSSHDYMPFGEEFEPTTTEWDNTKKGPRDPRKFTGHERDYFSAANVDGDYVDYMHARYYAPRWGRFLTVDPGGVHPGQPQSWNRYVYAANDPVNAVDPDGRATRRQTTVRAAGRAAPPTMRAAGFSDFVNNPDEYNRRYKVANLRVGPKVNAGLVSINASISSNVTEPVNTIRLAASLFGFGFAMHTNDANTTNDVVTNPSRNTNGVSLSSPLADKDTVIGDADTKDESLKETQIIPLFVAIVAGGPDGVSATSIGIPGVFEYVYGYRTGLMLKDVQTDKDRKKTEKDKKKDK